MLCKNKRVSPASVGAGRSQPSQGYKTSFSEKHKRFRRIDIALVPLANGTLRPGKCLLLAFGFLHSRVAVDADMVSTELSFRPLDKASSGKREWLKEEAEAFSAPLR